MKRNMIIGLLLLISGIALLQISAIPALANEIWVTPSEPELSLGNWSATINGNAHFSFGVPDNMESFTSAKILIISTKHLNFKYDVNITVASNGQSYKNGVESELNNQESVTAKELSEIDVSGIVPSTLVPGRDHISIAFSPHLGALPYIRVVGLRFTYAGPSGAQGLKGATGPQGSQGVEGQTGPAGATGPQGAQGPTGATGATGQKGATGPTGPAGSDGRNASVGIQLVEGPPPASATYCTDASQQCNWISVAYGNASSNSSCSCPAGTVFYTAVTDCVPSQGNCQAVSFSVQPTHTFVDTGGTYDEDNSPQSPPTGAQITMNVGANLSFQNAYGVFKCYCVKQQ
jgi:hypothetical protein